MHYFIFQKPSLDTKNNLLANSLIFYSLHNKKIMENTKVGYVNLVQNTDRKHPQEAEAYACIWLNNNDGRPAYPVLLTEQQLSNAHKRATKHPEDVVPLQKVSGFKNFLSKIFGL